MTGCPRFLSTPLSPGCGTSSYWLHRVVAIHESGVNILVLRFIKKLEFPSFAVLAIATVAVVKTVAMGLLI